MEDKEKQEVVDSDPDFGGEGADSERSKVIELNTNIDSQALLRALEGKLQETLGDMVGKQAAQQIQQAVEGAIEGMVVAPPAATEEEWKLAKMFRDIVEDHVEEQRQRGNEGRLRNVALHYWSSSMGALREMRLRDEVDLQEEESAAHVASHIAEVMFSIGVIWAAFRMDDEEMKHAFMAAPKHIVNSCDHQHAEVELVRFQAGVQDGWEATPVYAVIANDAAGLAGLVLNVWDHWGEETLQAMWETLREIAFVFPHALH